MFQVVGDVAMDCALGVPAVDDNSSVVLQVGVRVYS
jgi:hypothetical protein